MADPLYRLVLIALCLLLPGCAAIRDHQRNVSASRSGSAIDRMLWETPAFLRQHPDIRERKRGFWLDEHGRHAEAAAAFREAAGFADKPSQAMLAEYYREGRGVARDAATAYAWMDLAAERGYPLFLARRERYWAELSADAQQRALHIGQQLYAEFGDAVAKPRMAATLRRGRSEMTGSRVGSPGALTVYVPTDRGWFGIPGTRYYADHYWRPERYFEWIDAVHGRWPEAAVDVGPLRPEADPAE